MNRLIIKGRLTRDPEVKTTQTGKEVCNFSVAVDRRFKRDGEPTADFFRVQVWEKTAEFVGKYFRKGQEILCEGRIESSEYTDKDGVKRTMWTLTADNVEFCGSKSDNVAASAGQGVPAATTTAADNDYPF